MQEVLNFHLKVVFNPDLLLALRFLQENLYKLRLNDCRTRVEDFTRLRMCNTESKLVLTVTKLS